MGGSTSSTAKSNTLNQEITNALSKTMQTCSTQISQRQSLDVSGSYNIVSGVKMLQAIKFNAECIQEVENKAKMQTDIANAIKNFAKAEGQQFSATDTTAYSETNVDNVVQRTFNNEAINTITNSVNAEQGISISGDHNIVKDITMEQTNNMIAKATQKYTTDIATELGLKNDVDNSSDAKTKNILSFLTDWLGELGPMMMVIIVVGGFIFYQMFMGGGGGSSSSGQRPYYPQPQYPPQQQYAPQLQQLQQYAPPQLQQLQQYAPQLQQYASALAPAFNPRFELQR